MMMCHLQILILRGLTLQKVVNSWINTISGLSHGM